MAREEWDPDWFTRREPALPAEELDAYMAFLLEHTDLPRRVIQDVLDANDLFWDEKVAQWGMERTTQWAQGDDDVEPDGA